MSVIKMTDLDLAGRRVLMRLDLNVPLADGVIADDTRMRASLPGIEFALKAGARVMLMSHLGRPQEGIRDDKCSLAPVARRLTELLGCEVPLVEDWVDRGISVAEGTVALCENVRFNVGEKDNNDELARNMAAQCDVFVMDAFATAHRAQASTHGVAKYAPIACSGPLLSAELEALATALQNPAHPVVAIVGGAKVSTKLEALSSLIYVVDQLVVGGGIANTFIKAAGHSVGKSLCEHELVDTTRKVMQTAESLGADIPIPTDVVIGDELTRDAVATVRPVEAVRDDEMILDIGPESTQALMKPLKEAGTIVWNGPVGVFEFDQFGDGTRQIAEAIAESDAFSIAGGGDTLAAVAKYDVGDRISYISTGGGAFLEFLEGKELPAVAILEQRAAQN